MKTRLLIIVPIVVGAAISLPFLLESSRSFYQESYEDTLRYEVETDFLNKIRETGDDSDSMTFVVISKQDLFNRHENYCGFAHMETEQYWYFADTLNDVILSSNVTQDVTSWCEDDDDSCYCELREFIGVDRRSYEDFFREHVSTTCPIIPMPENATSFDPTNCKWIEKFRDSTSIPSAKEFLKMDCDDLTHMFPEFPSPETADAWNTRMHECINEQESLTLQIELEKWNEVSCLEILNNPDMKFEDNVDKRAFDIRWRQCLENEN